MLQVDLADPTPVPAQIERSLRAAVADGVLQPGDALPTTRQLSVQLRVNANLIAQAYRDLERAGLVELRPGMGVYVRDAGPAALHGAEREARLAEAEDRLLSEAASLGFSLDEVIIHLDSRRG
ncbi:MAG: ytrA 1 [Gemmatimonadetes bacterium]|nr:ytrA 1 [Gemmatimonadota bacterium]